MSISAEQKLHVVNLLRKKYVDWNGFDHQAFRREVVNYKRITVKKAVSHLSESKLAQLLVTRDIDSFIERLKGIGKATPLLNSNENSNGDLEILYVPTLDKPVFCAQVYHLLHGTEPVHERLASYLQYIETHELPNTWTFPTYLLQFCYPDTEFFVATRPTQWFLKFMGLNPSLGKPNADTYVAIKDYARILKYTMAEYRPQDMIDVQSMVQVCSDMSASGMPSYEEEDRYDPYQGGGGDNLGFGDSLGFGEALGRMEYDLSQPESGIPDIKSSRENGRPPGERIGSGGALQPELHASESSSSGSGSGSGSSSGSSWPSGISFETDPTMLQDNVSDDSRTQIRLSNSFPSVNGNGASASANDSLPVLFKKFVTGFMVSPAGVARAADYVKAREQAGQNFAHLIAEHELGEQVTDRVFLHLLPHKDSVENQNSGAWIHPVYHYAERVLAYLNKVFTGEPAMRPQVAQLLLEFIRHSVYKADAFDGTSEALARLDELGLFDVGTLSPILHALKPVETLLLHEHTLQVFKWAGGVEKELSLKMMPELNTMGLQLIRRLKEEARVETIPSVHETDLFDIFVWWLVENKFLVAPDETVVQSVHIPPSQAQRDASAPPLQSNSNGGGAHKINQEADSRLQAIVDNETAFEEYSLQDCAQETGVSINMLQQWLNTLERKRQIIFYGPSGTGKTYMARKIARGLTNGTDGLIQMVQFYAGYTYERFIGTLEKPGEFQQFCHAASHRSGPCVMILDEINRADIASVFGDVLTQLDREAVNGSVMRSPFVIPNNVLLIGTMVPGKAFGLFNDSVARRRFAVIPMMPDYEVLKNFHRDTSFQVDGLIRTLNQINTLVENPRFQIGITYFLRKDLQQHIEEIWRFEVEPCIEEAFYNDVEKIDSFRWIKMRRRLTR